MSFLRALPLSLTALRLLLGPLFVLLHRDHVAAEWLALIVFVALVTDWLDGAMARRCNAVSTAGKLLDPLADVIFCMMLLGDFALQSPPLVWPWLVVVLIVREALVNLLFRPLALWRGIAVAAGMLGKVKTSLQFGGIFLVLVMLVPGMEDMSLLAVLKTITFLAVLGCSLVSGGQYAVAVARILLQPRTVASGDKRPRTGAGGLDA